MASHMRIEALAAPAAAATCLSRNREAVGELAARLRFAPPAFVATSARGSSDHAALWLKSLIETRLGHAVASIGPSSASIYGAAPRHAGALHVTISQSGRSPDLLAALRAAGTGGAFRIALVNDETSPIALEADLTLPLCAGEEVSVAATKSCLSAMALGLALVAAWSADSELEAACDRLPGALERSARMDWSEAVASLGRTERGFVIGRGPGAAIAAEAALKLKETCRIHAEAFSAAEVRHGPMALAGPGFTCLAFAPPDGGARSVREAAEAMRTSGAEVILAGEQDGDQLKLPHDHEPLLMHLGALQSFYLLAEATSRSLGLDPDRPPGLTKVTSTL